MKYNNTNQQWNDRIISEKMFKLSKYYTDQKHSSPYPGRMSLDGHLQYLRCAKAQRPCSEMYSYCSCRILICRVEIMCSCRNVECRNVEKYRTGGVRLPSRGGFRIGWLGTAIRNSWGVWRRGGHVKLCSITTCIIECVGMLPKMYIWNV